MSARPARPPSPRRRLPESVVLIDGACPLCRRTAHVLHRLDVFARVDFADANDEVALGRLAPGVSRRRALEEMVVVQPARGRVALGLDGYALLGRSIPALAPLTLLAALPGLGWLGRRAYRFVAARRPRTLPCTDETCSLASLPAPLPRRAAA